MKPAAQAAEATKAAKTAAANQANTRPKFPEALAGRPRHSHPPHRADKVAGGDRGDRVDGDGDADGAVRLLTKAEVLDRVGLSFPTVWQWMREGKFPRSRVLSSNKSVWIEFEISKWIASLPVRKLKGDADVAA